jgi:hypothetical protein
MPSLLPDSPKDDDKSSSLSQETTNRAVLASESRVESIGDVESSSSTADSVVPNHATTKDTAIPIASQHSEIRRTVGGMTVRISDFVNSHLIAVRYGIFSTIAVLTAYGLVHSPLFFRYRNVSEIPSRYFQQRRHLHGRLIRCNRTMMNPTKNDTMTKTPAVITCWIRHLSPIERCLSKNILDVLWKWHPAASLSRGEGSTDDLMCVQIAGIQYPQYPSTTSADLESNNKTSSSSPTNSSSSSSSLLSQMSPHIQQMMRISSPDSSSSTNSNSDSKRTQQQQQQHNTHRIPQSSFLLEQLVAQRTPIRMQLLARRSMPPSFSTPTTPHLSSTMVKKRPLPEFSTASSTATSHSEENPKTMMMICQLYYREHPFQLLFPRDLGMMLVAQGQAVVSEQAGVWWHDGEDETTEPPETSPRNRRSHFPPSHAAAPSKNPIAATAAVAALVRDDVRYWERLVTTEMRAARESRGIWDDPRYRDSRPEMMTEMEFQSNANLFQKLWRWIREKR